MPTQSSKKFILAAAVIVILAAVAFYLYSGESSASWVTYDQNDVGLSLKHPSDWRVFDTMNPQSICCVFVLNYEESATTTFDGPGRVKMQIGSYDISQGFDPFQLGSTTEIALGKNKVYKGSNSGVPFYIIPRSETEGFGVAFFSPAAEQAQAAEAVEEIIATIELRAQSPMTSTSTATSTATSTVR